MSQYSTSTPTFAIPVKQRAPLNPIGWLHFLAFNVVFQFGMLCLHGAQLTILPLHLSKQTLPYFNELADYSKTMFGRLLVFISQFFAPTTLRITVDKDDLDELDLKKIVQRDERGIVVGIDLPDRMVLMSNHQVYCDWSYIWNLLYFASLESSIVIILKASLKWVPLVGPAMQIYRFIFVNRSWGSDQQILGKAFVKLAETANRSLKPFVLMIFPEGTLVSPITRPVSTAYAKKTSIEDCKHTLLPRSTGLLFALRTLSPRVPTLRLLDVTIGYPGIPAGGYGQDYYTLQSIYGAGVPPPIIHMHLRSYVVKYDVPIGRDSLSTSTTTAGKASPEERKIFDDWVLNLWREKDERLGNFIESGRMSDSEYIDIPIRLRKTSDLVGLCVSFLAGFWLGKFTVAVVYRLMYRLCLQLLLLAFRR